MAGVEVRGLDQFRKELRALDKSFGREMGKANKEAADVVAQASRAKASAKGGVTAKASPSIVASAAQRVAKVAIGGPRYPYGPGSVTGSKKYPQFGPWQGPDYEDWHAIGPAVRDTEDKFIDVYGDVLEKLASRAFPN